MRRCVSGFAAIENLEPRRLLAVTLENAILSIIGTTAKDRVVVQRDPETPTLYMVTFNGEVSRHVRANVSRLNIDVGAGNDFILIEEIHGLVTPHTTIAGGRGHDTIAGGSRNELLGGGVGNDWIEGRGGDDHIEGSAGDDTLFGGDGNDTLIAAGGNDFLYGDEGNDALSGGADDDVLGGDDENLIQFINDAQLPLIVGHDSLEGARGNDWLLGGQESDGITDNNGVDTMSGGAGVDVVDARGRDDIIQGAEAQDYTPANTAPTPGPLVIHDHYQLDVLIRNTKGKWRQVLIPTSVGIFDNVMGGSHTHDATGRIHNHDGVVRDFTLGEFFKRFGISFDARHVGRYFASSTRTMSMTVNDVPNTEFGNYVTQNGDHVVIRLG